MKKIKEFKGQYFFLSNYYPSPIHQEFEDGTIIDYPTVEHAFQACKSTDIEVRKHIAACESPGQAKHMGRHVKLRKDWNAIKTDVMLSLVRGKFQWPELQKKLLATGDAYLEEGNTWSDTCWGVCNGRGENRLGKILMQVRDEIKRGELPVYNDKKMGD